MTAAPARFSRHPLFALAAAVLLAALAWTLYADSRQGVESSRRQLAASTQRLEQAEQALARARATAEAFQAALPAWQSLRAAGRLEQGTANEWLDHARSQLAQQGIDADLALRPPEPEPISAPAASAPITRHQLDVDAELVHEGHLFKLINALRQLPGALVAGHSCRLRRHASQAGAISAQCRFDWLQVNADADREHP